MITLPWVLRPVRGVTIGSSLTDAEVDTLVDVARGGVALEVGTAYGYTTCRLAEVGHVVTVDPHGGYGTHPVPDSWPAARDNAIAAELTGHITFIHGRSGHVLPNLMRMGCRFSLVFIDGDHAEPAVYHDLMTGWTLTADGGMLAAHDYDEATCPGVRPAIERFERDVEPVERGLRVDTLWTASR